MSDAGEKAWRLVKLVSLVESKYPRYSRQDIQDILDISSSSFYRYVKDLEDAGIPICQDDKTGNYKIREDYYLSPPKLNLSEALALIIGSKSIIQDSNFPYYEKANLALAKVVDTLPDKINSVLSTVEDRIHFSLNSLVDYNSCKEVFNKLDQAISEEKNVWVKYYTHSRDETSERTISPYVLDYKEGFFYLIGYCHWREQVKMFRVDRIREIKVTADEFEYPDDFSLQEYLGDTWGVERREETIEVKVEFSGDMARWVQENEYHPSQEITELDDGDILMEFETCSINEVKKWVLGFGAKAEVLEPEELREEIESEIEEMNGIYSS
jgi:predicted DNA-binding transcriptional regulator YafY